MPTYNLELEQETGLGSLTVKLAAAHSNTVAATVTMTERSNMLGIYAGSFTGTLADGVFNASINAGSDFVGTDQFEILTAGGSFQSTGLRSGQAASIWAFSSRTLTSWTTFVSEIVSGIYQLLIGSRVAVSSLPATATDSTLLELVNNADATITLQAATTSGARLVFSLGCVSAETPQLEADTVGGLLTLQGETAANPTDAVVTRVDADTVTVRIKARAMSVLPVRVHGYELRELAGDGSVVSRWEGEISLRRTAGKRIS